MITEQRKPTLLDVTEDAEALWKHLQEKRPEWWLKAPLPEVRAKLLECFHTWNVAREGEYDELLHLMVISRILALRVREERA